MPLLMELVVRRGFRYKHGAPNGACLRCYPLVIALDIALWESAAVMANTYTQIYVQVVFAVQGRQSLVRPERKEELRNT